MEEQFVEGQPTSIAIASPNAQWEANPVGSFDPTGCRFIACASKLKLSNPYLDNPGAIQ